jgi:DNA-binding FadR family transcriptional regulator
VQRLPSATSPLEDRDEWRAATTAHESIVAAILVGDATLARQRMADHLGDIASPWRHDLGRG